MNEKELVEIYQQRCTDYLYKIADELKIDISKKLSDVKRIDRISVRVKDTDSFLKKSEKLDDNGEKKYPDPINEIQDQIGARIICFYKDDAIKIHQIICEYFTSTEIQFKEPKKDSEFDYFGIHLVLFIPADIRPSRIPKNDCPEFFELQIKTLFQHAWSEANHDIYYKQDKQLSKEQRRKIAFTAAQAWGADIIFDELAEDLISDYKIP